MIQRFDNHMQVAQAKCLVRSICREATDFSYFLKPNTNTVLSIYVSVPQKKNKKKILKLLSRGFKSVRRRLEDGDFIIDLRYDLIDNKEEKDV